MGSVGVVSGLEGGVSGCVGAGSVGTLSGSEGAGSVGAGCVSFGGSVGCGFSVGVGSVGTGPVAEGTVGSVAASSFFWGTSSVVLSFFSAGTNSSSVGRVVWMVSVVFVGSVATVDVDGNGFI